MVEQKKKPDYSRAVVFKSTAGSSNSGLALQPSQPVIDILPNLILGNSIALLDFAFELVTTAVDRSEVVVEALIEAGEVSRDEVENRRSNSLGTD